MKSFFAKIILFIFLGLAPAATKAQDVAKKTKKRSLAARWEDRKAVIASRKQNKKKWKEDREEEMYAKKSVKQHHKKLQSKLTLKSMRENKKRSDRSRVH